MATTPPQEPTLEPTLEDLRNPGGTNTGNTTELDRSEESSTTSLYSAAIGSLGKNYYLPIFNRFEAADRGGISWNWAASLSTLNWLAFRKLWSAALAYAGTGVGLALLIFGIGRLVFRFSEEVEMLLLVAYLALMFVTPGLFANALLHADSRKRMARALAANTTLPEACDMLARQAPTRNRLIALAVVNLLVVGALAGVYLKFPSASSLPIDTIGSLAAVNPVGTRPVTSASAALTASAPATAAAANASAPAAVSATASPPISAPASAPTPAGAIGPASAASAPNSTASTPKAAASAAQPSASATNASAAMARPSAAASAPSTPASVPAKTASAAGGRVAIGAVQPEPARKASAPSVTPASAPVRTSPTPQPVASSPQEVGKVYRSEPMPPTTPLAAPVAAKAAAPVAGKPGTAPVAVTKPSPPASGAKTDGKYLVNVGLFAQEANASNAMAKLKEAQLPAYTEEIRSPTKGKLTRVRVGPFADQAEADAAAAKIRALGLDALVARL